MKQDTILELKNFKAHFRAPWGRVSAVDGVSFSIAQNEIAGIVGESGCGKSVMAQSIIRLLEHTDPIEYEGEIVFRGEDLLSLPLSQIQRIRGNAISMIFQDPLSSLNPVYTIGNQLVETLRKHKKMKAAEAREQAIDLLDRVGIPSASRRFRAYPHELSGGMQQRVMIAIALACEPRILIADEPTTALDTTIQAQILELIAELNQRTAMAVLFISHDLGLIAELCATVKVMYLGQIVEEAPTAMLFENPLHPYTQGLMKSIPSLEGDRTKDLYVIRGTVPSLRDIPRGCRFSSRCQFAGERCFREEPPGESAGGEHRVKCWLYGGTAGAEGGSHG
jgi:oligopeptide/dipeptide ABC transporter ATP-binding protein